MMFERFSKSRRLAGADGREGGRPEGVRRDRRQDAARNQLLIFSRWCQVMLRFEKGMYENPEQDLNKLWWDLVEKYQMVKRPAGRNAPDYGSKIHIVSAPVYYHNYMMGELFASQVHHAIARDVFGGGARGRRCTSAGGGGGAFWREVLGGGGCRGGGGLTLSATGERLNAEGVRGRFQGEVKGLLFTFRADSARNLNGVISETSPDRAGGSRRQFALPGRGPRCRRRISRSSPRQRKERPDRP